MTYVVILAVVFGVIGAAIGSFLNVLIYRLNNNLSPIEGRSFCDHCRALVSWQDNIPLLSFILLKGRCRSCQKSIHWHNPAVEAVAAFSFGLIAFEKLGNLKGSGYLGLGFQLFLTSSFIVLFFSDLLYYTLPDKVIFPTVGLSLIYLSFFQPALILQNLAAAIASAAFFLTLTLLTQGKGMGLGDAKLVFLLGLLLGPLKTLVALYAAFVLGSIIGLGLVLFKQKKLGQTIPFGPFLIIGFLLVEIFNIQEFLLDLFLK